MPRFDLDQRVEQDEEDDDEENAAADEKPAVRLITFLGERFTCGIETAGARALLKFIQTDATLNGAGLVLSLFLACRRSRGRRCG